MLVWHAYRGFLPQWIKKKWRGSEIKQSSKSTNSLFEDLDFNKSLKKSLKKAKQKFKTMNFKNKLVMAGRGSSRL